MGTEVSIIAWVRGVWLNQSNEMMCCWKSKWGGWGISPHDCKHWLILLFVLLHLWGHLQIQSRGSRIHYDMDGRVTISFKKLLLSSKKTWKGGREWESHVTLIGANYCCCWHWGNCNGVSRFSLGDAKFMVIWKGQNDLIEQNFMVQREDRTKYNKNC